MCLNLGPDLIVDELISYNESSILLLMTLKSLLRSKVGEVTYSLVIVFLSYPIEVQIVLNFLMFYYVYRYSRLLLTKDINLGHPRYKKLRDFVPDIYNCETFD